MNTQGFSPTDQVFLSELHSFVVTMLGDIVHPITLTLSVVPRQAPSSHVFAYILPEHLSLLCTAQVPSP